MLNSQKGRGIMLANASVIANISMQFVSKLISARVSSQYMLCLRSILLLVFNTVLIRNSQRAESQQLCGKQATAGITTFDIKNTNSDLRPK
jgi:hypothetical protein